MSDTENPHHNQPIAPVSFRPRSETDEPADIASGTFNTPSDRPGESTRGAHVRARVLWAGLITLLVIAGFVFGLLPQTTQSPVGKQTVPPRPVSAGTPAPSGSSGTSSTQKLELAPWQTAQLLREKKAAEALTEQFVRLQMELEDAQVNLWGASRFGQAINLAQEGDGQFSQRDFQAATASYEQGLALLRALRDDSGGILAGALERGNQALAAYDEGAAKEAFTLALAMAPDNREARTGLARAQTTAQVAGLAQQAAALEDRGELEAARDTLIRAGELDPADTAVTASRKRLDQLLGNRQFDTLMSSAYAHIDAGRAGDALQAFGKAAKLRPNSPEVKEGLEQAESLQRLQRIAELQAQAASLEAGEQWERAAKAYAAALGLDSSLVFARDGLRRARERAALDKRISDYIQQPERLQADAVYQAAQQILQIATAIEPRTPILGRQISELEKVVTQSRQPVNVLIESDNQTEVSLVRLGPLGVFLQRKMALRPGNYVAIGKRKGYREVRRGFVVRAGGSEPLHIQVSCEEQI